MADSLQYVDNNSTTRRKSVKQKCRNLYSENDQTCIVTQKWPFNNGKVKETQRCDYCGKYAKDRDLTTYWTQDKYLMCRECKEKRYD